MSDKLLKDRAYEIALNQRRYASMVYEFFDKKTGSGPIATSKAGVNINKVLAHLQKLQKPVNKKSRKESLCEV